MNIWSPTQHNALRKTVEDLLLAQGVIDAERLQQARTVQQSSKGKRISQVLLEMGAISEDDVQKALATVLNLPFEIIDPKALDRRAHDLLSAEFMKARGCFGLRLDEGRLTLGMVDPANVFLIDEVKRQDRRNRVIRPVVVCQYAINAAIETANAG